MERLLHDVRYALRHLQRSPAFVAASVLILGVGIGASTAIFSIVDSILFRPLGLPDSDRLLTLCEVHQGDRTYCSVSPANALDWRDGARTLETVGVARGRSIQLRRGAGETAVGAAMATHGFLEALGVQPLHGRLLREEDMLPHGTGNAIVLSYELWRDEFGGDDAVVGQTVIASSGGDGRVLRDEPLTIVGVLPAGVEAPRLEFARAWIPLQLDARSEEYRGWRGFIGIARLTEGATLAQARDELAGLQARLAEVYPEHVRNWTVHAERMRDYLVADMRGLLLLFLGAVGVVLAIVCVNLTGLLLARTMQRQRELTVCAALGATRGRLAGQMLAEAGVLALLGGIGGVLLATWLVDAFVALAPSGIPRLDDVKIDARLLVFAIVSTAVTGLVFGVASALRLRGVRLYDALQLVRSGTADRAGSRARRALVVAQLAMALMLALSAGLLLRSFARQVAFDPGFRLEGLLTFQVYPPMWRYATAEQRADFYRRAEEALEAIPGVASAGTASAGPLFGGGDGRTPFLVHGRPAVPVQEAPGVLWYNAGPGYFPALGVPVILGRNLSETDRNAATPAALISQSMARRHWPDTSPVGALLTLPGWDTDVEIVGVVPDLRLDHTTPPEPSIYVSDRQLPRGASFFVVRTTGDPVALVPAVRQVFRELDPDVEPRAVATLEELLGATLTGPRFSLLLITLFATVALVLSASGIYAVIAYTVATRRREFGVRMALGARRDQVLRLVMADGGMLLAGGLVIGLVGAAFFTRLLRGVIHDIPPADPIALAGAVIVLGVTAAAATVVPAVRASRTETGVVLRGE